MDKQMQPPAAGTPAYNAKRSEYFAGARLDIVAKMPANPSARILEIGCGSGETGEAALKAGKAAEYFGVELNAAAAVRARDKLTQVIIGNIEVLPPQELGKDFDCLVMSEVLEHLSDPWGALIKLVGLLKPGASVFCSSPNIASKAIVWELLAGRFEYDDEGPMDRTHLRWFTPSSYQAMFEQAGIAVTICEPVAHFHWKARLINALTGGRFRHLFITQILISGHKR